MSDDWQDCTKLGPYRDYQGRWVWFPFRTERRTVIRDGVKVTEYRERAVRGPEDDYDNYW